MSGKTLDVTSGADAKAKVSDVKIVGNPDTFALLCKASSRGEGWMKSAKACVIPGHGAIVQVTTQQGANVAEALTFVPGSFELVDDINGGRKIVRREIVSAYPMTSEGSGMTDTQSGRPE